MNKKQMEFELTSIMANLLSECEPVKLFWEAQKLREKIRKAKK